MKKYIAYYRVSTQRQGVSGLGLEAQQDLVKRFISSNELIAEFTDVESGAKNNRPELLKALELTNTSGGTLVVAKLDRLSRNLTFISILMDSKVKFICADMPEANELTIHLFASIAQWERKRISERTIDALAILKKRGVKLGSPKNLTDESRKNSIKVRSMNAKVNENNIKAKSLVKALVKTGMNYSNIARELNEAGFKTSKGFEFRFESVKRLSKS